MKTHLNTLVISLVLATTLSLGTFAQSVGDAAPNFTLNNLEENSFSLSNQKGKVVFIFFFGNNCPHCIANGPNTQTDIYAKYKDNPNFVAIGIDTFDGNAQKVQGFKSTTGIEYPLLLNGSTVKTAYGTNYDRIIIVDSEGIIQYKSTTNADKTSTAAASVVISNLLYGTTGINDLQAASKEFLLAPNSVGNELIVGNPFKQTQQVKLEIIDLTGKVVLRQNNIELIGKTNIDISRLQSGFFTLVVSSKNDYRIAKFIKIR